MAFFCPCQGVEGASSSPYCHTLCGLAPDDTLVVAVAVDDDHTLEAHSLFGQVSTLVDAAPFSLYS